MRLGLCPLSDRYLGMPGGERIGLGGLVPGLNLCHSQRSDAGH